LPLFFCREHFEFIHAGARSQFLSRNGAHFYQRLAEAARKMPLNEARDYLDGLADLIEYHPGLADERQALYDLLTGECTLVKSRAVTEAIE
jgi:hypothetical protein